MTKQSIWKKRWARKSKDIMGSTSLDFFALRAFQVLDKSIGPKDDLILEIGSGTGRFCIALAKKYPSKKIIGIDYTDESVALSNKGAKMRGLSKVEFKKADLFQLPFPDNHFDLVFENGVIEHFKNYPEALLEMKRVVKKGGKIIVNVNNWYCFPKTIEKKILGKYYPFGYEKSFKHKEVIKAFKELGLTDIKVFAYNPANSVVRFFFFNKIIKRIVSLITLFMEKLLDLLSQNRFSKRCGYMIFGVGRK